jgi:hypothetical protein
MLIDVHEELQTDSPPEVCQSHVDTERSQLRLRIKRKGSTVWHEAGKGITVEVVSVCGIGGPIRIGMMGCDNLDSPPRLRDPVQLVNEAKDVRDMLDNVATDNFVKFIVTKRIRKDSQIMNDIGLCARVCIHADCAGKFILPASHIQNLLRDFGVRSGVKIEDSHEC